jgi:hypothetical protein
MGAQGLLFDRAEWDGVERTAKLSADNVYRYRLGRRWGEGAPLLFVMLNPSTADARIDDRTIRRCMSFAKRDGFPAIDVVNLFAFRATFPRDLRSAKDPIGPENDEEIADALKRAGQVIAAWGVSVPRPHAHRPARVLELLKERGAVWALRITPTGAPEHPLYIPGDAPLVVYP